MRARQTAILLFLSFSIFTFYNILILVKISSKIKRGLGNIKYRTTVNSDLKSLKIPKKIHQIWKNADLSTYPIKTSREEWIKKYPDYKVILWTEKDILHLIKQEYPWLFNLYINYKYPIQRADVARYIILYHEGGIYADLDCFPSGTKVDEILDADLVLTMTLNSNGVSNHFMMAAPKLKFMKKVLNELKYYNDFIIFPYLRVFYSTGPLFLTIQLNSYKDEMDFLLQSQLDNHYNTHSIGRSWLLIDGKIANWIGDNAFKFKMILAFLSFSFLLCVVLILYSRKKKIIYKSIIV